ncbi:MAG: hypothetical protein V2I97_23560, partial [Desulfococcaceae bacterium]|nr:hypothetical protein [Desulfococcaceae bacterium]
VCAIRADSCHSWLILIIFRAEIHTESNNINMLFFCPVQCSPAKNTVFKTINLRRSADWDEERTPADSGCRGSLRSPQATPKQLSVVGQIR